MRTKIKTKRNESDFTKSLLISPFELQRIEKSTKDMLLKELDLSEIIEKVWNDKKYSDHGVIWIIFNLGMARARKDASEAVIKQMGSIDIESIIKKIGGLGEK